ncbi:protein of unknown function [Micropruina glycogenica]|uniref:Uncharacterized protein n=1 Tax=Micropruina glycogenica TaxID=75385 RepID=A0A2N9JLA3_9ACTN|nr:protein of unknown function [Micropruina glycogenica]
MASRGRSERRSAISRNTSLPASAHECDASATIEAEPVNTAATVFAMPINRLAAKAMTTVSRLSPPFFFVSLSPMGLIMPTQLCAVPPFGHPGEVCPDGYIFWVNPGGLWRDRGGTLRVETARTNEAPVFRSSSRLLSEPPCILAPWHSTRSWRAAFAPCWLTNRTSPRCACSAGWPFW